MLAVGKREGEEIVLSIYDLAYTLAEQTSTYTPAGKRQILEEVRQKLREGWTADDILQGRKRQGDNLVDPDHFYYHSQLHLTPPPPVTRVNLETGEIEEVSEPWYLEIRCSYRLDDLLDYYLSRFPAEESEMDRIIGAMKWLVRRYDLDLILFMIDACYSAVLQGEASPPESPLRLRNFLTEAQEALEQKRNEMAEMGVTGVVPKQRKPLSVH